ncbi:hypothetical protein PAXRUDRAFT_156654 [Paxillus rubicundulus Ve08.2h10]|uniref:Uncharacterized protein n=1 Tax=Paxillus rubicundulus Ve08.2h10 TaxID=930991 RepID=A0A0D0DI49_9AGAM|nr:hypothetical protein PAXRUDRAFT_156654 [Paxillus rubicundulus Ve08.2h10]
MGPGSSSSKQSQPVRWVCVCQKFSFGRPHQVSTTTFYEHLEQADTEDEWQQIHAQKLMTLEMATLLSSKLVKSRQCSRAWTKPRLFSECLSSYHFNENVPLDDQRPQQPSPPPQDPPGGSPPPPPPPSPPPLSPPHSPHHPPSPPPENPSPHRSHPLPDRQLSPPPNPNPPPNPPQIRQHILYNQRQPPPFDLEALVQAMVLPKLRKIMDYVLLVKNAALEDPIAQMDDDMLGRIWNPPQGPLQIDSPGIHHSIAAYLALEHASQEAYKCVIHSTRRQSYPAPDGVDDELLSFKAVEKLIALYTGIDPIWHDMCPDSCVGFTRPFEDLDDCLTCNKS